MTTPLAAKIAKEYGTPSAVIDMDKVERNIARIQAACEAAGVANRPHIKTHKSPMLAKMQVAAGAKGITCQKLGEAEIMADNGINDILISYNLLGDEKMARLGALQGKPNVTDEALAGVRAHGLDARIVSTGGTPNLVNIGKLKGGTEHRFGTYIYNDRMQVAAGSATWDDCALHIYSTVVSRAAPERGILDAGSKTLTTDTGGLEGHGLILEHPEAKIAKFAEEHGFLDLTRSNTRPKVGDVVRIVPNHVCVVVNMMDEVVMVRGEEILGNLPVAARGKLR